MSPELEAAIERMRNHVMTPEEKFEQRVSFVYGQQDYDKPGKSKDEIRQMLIDSTGYPPCQKCAALEASQAGVGGRPDAYDAGLLSDFGGGNVDWWWDYIRTELARAHDFYAEQFSALTTPTRIEAAQPQEAVAWLLKRGEYRELAYTRLDNDPDWVPLYATPPIQAVPEKSK